MKRRKTSKSKSELIKDTITRKKQRALQKVKKIYSDIADDDKRLVEDFMGIIKTDLHKGLGRSHSTVKNATIMRRKSILDLGGIAKGRKKGTGNEREYTKKVMARKVAIER